MRQVIIELEPYEETKAASASTFTHIHSYEVLEVLKMDHEEGLYVDLIECHTKEGVSIDDLRTIGDMEVLSVIRSEGDRHTCLVRGHESDDTKNMFKEAELDLIYTTPSIISEDRITVSFIGAQKDLMTFVELVKEYVGKITNMTFKRAVYQKKDVISVLTDKQREVMVAAYRHGYYDLPKRISSESLSGKVNISKPTLLEHLRKAERRIFTEIMEGYSEY